MFWFILSVVLQFLEKKSVTTTFNRELRDYTIQNGTIGRCCGEYLKKRINASEERVRKNTEKRIKKCIDAKIVIDWNVNQKTKKENKQT